MESLLSAERFQEFFDAVVIGAVEAAPKIFFAVMAFWVLIRAERWGLQRLESIVVERNKKKNELPGEAEKRIRTLFTIFDKILIVLIWVLSALVFLSLIGVDIAPIIAAFGIFGLAISFGSQTLVKDVIGGAFIIFENQIRVGDVANINGTGGLVEEINLRTTVLRDQHGTVHVFPNGSITKLSNLTKDWSAAVLDIGVAYKEDIDKVLQVLGEVAAETRKDDQFAPMITHDAEILGVESFADSAVVIRMRVKTLPIQQFGVARELRRRIKYAFDKAGIEIPFPHRTLFLGDSELGDALKKSREVAVN